jgi:hypothetical protein
MVGSDDYNKPFHTSLRMIVSHERKFIFLKTHKTAGTTAELVLSQYCGPDDTITQLVDSDETLRKGRGPQNYTKVYTWQAKAAKLRWHLRGLGPYYAYSEHAEARKVRWAFGAKVWNRYYKFSIERNPWDREVSRYFWNTEPHNRPPFAKFVTEVTKISPLNNFAIYSIDGVPAVDKIIRFENFEHDFRSVLAAIGVPVDIQLPRAKSAKRTSREHYQSFYSEETRDIIATTYAREIAHFGFVFGA